jgi:hypothetical protein
MAEPLFSGRKVAQGSAIQVGKPNCMKCGLKRKSIATHPGTMGKGEEGILIVLESLDMDPAAEKYLRSTLHSLNHDLDKDCWRVGAIGCRPRKDKTSSGVVCCRPALMSAIKEKQPKKIIALGNSALGSLLGHRWTHEQLGKLTRWRGHRTPDRDLRTWLYVTYSPSYISQLDKKDKAIKNTFKRDLRNAIRHTDTPVNWDFDPEKSVRILTDTSEIKRAIRQYRKSGELVSFDYEGSGLKYHAKGHFIHTASLATPELGAVSFPFYPDIVPAWIRFLESDVPKTAHNMKFEETVGYEMLDTRTKGWRLCTMQGAHVLDNRKGVAGIEFQTYTRLGFLPWGMDIKKYFAKRGKSANTVNNIKEAPIRSVLLYGGMDSLSQNMLAHLPEFEGLWIK